MADDEYIELLKGAKDALHDAIMASEPGTGMSLHTAYTDLKSAIKTKEKRAAKQEHSEEWKAERDRTHEAETAWRKVSHPHRAMLILNLLGDDRLLTHEVVTRFGEKHPQYRVYYTAISALLRRMWKEGNLDRAGEGMTPGSKRIVHRYFVRRALEGPIVDLERTFHEEPVTPGGQNASQPSASSRTPELPVRRRPWP